MCKRFYKSLFVILMLLVAGGLHAQGTDPGTENLTHSWNFDDGTADDAVGGVNGTIVGDAVIEYGALFLSEVGQWVELDGFAIDMASYEAVTVEAWFLPLAGMNTSFHMLWYFGDQAGDAGSYGFFYSPARADDKSRTAISITDTSPWANESGADGPEVDDDVVHHAVCILDSTDIAYFLDGELQAITPLSEINKIEGISPNFAWIGRGGYTNDPSWVGEVYEVNIYNKAVTPEEVEFMFLDNPTSVEEAGIDVLPKEYALSQNYPNPFNPTTSISYTLPKAENVTLTVFNLLGEKIATLVNSRQAAGVHTVEFNAADLSSGIYLYQLRTNNQTLTKQMMLIK